MDEPQTGNNSENCIRKLSTGEEPTLGNYRKMAKLLFGENSNAVFWMDLKISAEEEGADTVILVEERQVVWGMHKMNEIHKIVL